MTNRHPGSHALTFVLITVLLDMIGIGIVMPVFPRLIENIAGVDVASASIIGGWLVVAYAAMQFLFGPVIGNLSDAYGRRPTLLLSVGGLGLDYIFMALAPSIAWLFVGRLVAGICGASYTVANAFIADITTPENRARAFGYIGAAFGVGFIIGPALGGLLAHFGERTPFFVAAGLSIANFVYGCFVLPETLPVEKRRGFALARANPLGSLLALRRHRLMLGFSAVLFLHFLATNAYPAVWAYYTIYRYGWSELEIGLSLAAFGAMTALVQGGLVGPFIRYAGERMTALISLTVECVIAVGYAFATQGWMIYVLLVVGALQGIAMPAINAMMTHRVADDEQGELQGAISSLMGIGAIIGPVVATQLFGAFAGPHAIAEIPGMPFVMTALLSALALWIFVKLPAER